jgi:UDP-N-acetylmuramyl tripeptide synthase
VHYHTPVAAPAYAIARAAGVLSRRLGRGGGTSLPGKLLIRWRPEAIRDLSGTLPGGAIVLSATNGKTTTARLLAACLRAGGHRLVTNPSGANLVSGVATALLATSSDPDGADLGLFEVDEAALPVVADQLRPRVVLLMNLFRDQLDRYGELEELAARWRTMLEALPPEVVVVLNADDPAVAALGDAHPGATYFGIDDPAPVLSGLPHAADSKRCRRCDAPLVYDVVYLGHLGHWRCETCGWSRPRPDVRATRVVVDGLSGVELEVATPAGAVAARLPLPGLHNAYNATAAVAAASVLGIAPALIAGALQEIQAAFGRAERVHLDGHDVLLLLVKNPAGANETIRTLLLDPDPIDLLIALNDRTADGRDVSWIWDVDFEPLLGHIRQLTLTGDRAYDLALRFRYAGFPPERMRLVPDLERAVDAAVAAAPDGRPIPMLPTYTAMLDLRRILVRRGAAEAFWRDR